MEGVKTHMGIIDVFKGERNVIPKQEVKPFRVSQKQWRSSGDSRTNEGRAEMDKKVSATVSLFFKIIGSEMGGEETLYSESKIDLNTVDLSGFNLQEYAQSQIRGYAELLKVPEENIQIVSRQEYEENTDDD